MNSNDKFNQDPERFGRLCANSPDPSTLETLKDCGGPFVVFPVKDFDKAWHPTHRRLDVFTLDSEGRPTGSRTVYEDQVDERTTALNIDRALAVLSVNRYNITLAQAQKLMEVLQMIDPV